MEKVSAVRLPLVGGGKTAGLTPRMSIITDKVILNYYICPDIPYPPGKNFHWKGAIFYFNPPCTTMINAPLHTFHIPVMGIAYTIDSPVKVARYGISSVVSVVEDRLIEMMRKHYYPVANREYFPIPATEPDYRAKRITDYLNLVNTIVQDQVDRMKQSAFETGSDLLKYFDMLPEDSTLKRIYRQMLSTADQIERFKLETWLREQVRPGSIDVNIMTKVDRNVNDANGRPVEDGSDAVAALRGYANSNLTNSSVIFSAGMNPRLYNYLDRLTAFDSDAQGQFAKKVVVKVSDYRSALIQGKYLAKKGIWVSEFRIESGLNCGGHAFATDGYLLGPILEEFKTNRQDLVDALFDIYRAALAKKGKGEISQPPSLIVTVQGGIGTHAEAELMHDYYDIASTGWGTPFLLVPEATTVDDATLKLLCDAKEKDVVLSKNSPLGIRFFYLKGTTSDTEKATRKAKGKPGSPCTEKHLAFNTEFTTEPICTASIKYQQLKMEQLQSLNLPEKEFNTQLNEVLDKECLCIGLCNAAAITYKEDFVPNLHSVNICPGPNIANFSQVVSLQTMTDHIYGRTNILTNPRRPHMFTAELYLYLDYLKEQLEADTQSGQFSKRKKYYDTFCKNLGDGIQYYRQLATVFDTEGDPFLHALDDAEFELDGLNYQYEISEPVKVGTEGLQVV